MVTVQVTLPSGKITRGKITTLELTFISIPFTSQNRNPCYRLQKLSIHVGTHLLPLSSEVCWLMLILFRPALAGEKVFLVTAPVALPSGKLTRGKITRVDLSHKIL